MKPSLHRLRPARQTANTSGPDTSFVFHRNWAFGMFGPGGLHENTTHLSASKDSKGTSECEGLEDDYMVHIVVFLPTGPTQREQKKTQPVGNCILLAEIPQNVLSHETLYPLHKTKK